MLDSAIQVNLFLMQYCRTLVKDIPDERMAEQPHEGVNHPAWILGHLSLTGDGALGLLGVQKSLPPEWATLFGRGSKPSTARSTYPSKAELLETVEQKYAKARQKAAAATPELLSQPNANARLKETLPTSKDLVAFLLTGHLAGHLGQLSAWRRMIGLGPLF
jgi:hypothetical protein